MDLGAVLGMRTYLDYLYLSGSLVFIQSNVLLDFNITFLSSHDLVHAQKTRPICQLDIAHR